MDLIPNFNDARHHRSFRINPNDNDCRLTMQWITLTTALVLLLANVWWFVGMPQNDGWNPSQESNENGYVTYTMVPDVIPTSPPLKSKRILPRLYPPDPTAVWYFHHIPKCAGTATERAMRQAPGFASDVIRDDDMAGPHYLVSDRNGTNSKHTHVPRPGMILTGHWPAGAFQRYPQLLDDPFHHRIFAIVRDPWDTRLSLYWYHRQGGIIPRDIDIEAYMLSQGDAMARIRRHGNQRPHRFWYAQRPRVVNYLPYYFQCHNQSDCLRVLDRYAFLGVVGIQEAPNPLRPLALLKTGDPSTAPDLEAWKDINRRKTSRVSLGLNYQQAMARIDTPENRVAFERLNALDYWLYDECLKRYRADWQRLVVAGLL